MKLNFPAKQAIAKTFIARLYLLPLLALCLFVSGRLLAQDAPSGFGPGAINIFAGGLNSTNANGIPLPGEGGIQATQAYVGSINAEVIDSDGNVYISGASVQSGGIYIIYAGGALPAVLAAVTTNATPAVTPQAGYIYALTGSPSASCLDSGHNTTDGCDGYPLNEIYWNTITSLVIDSQNNLYFVDLMDQVIRKVDASTGIVHTVVGQWLGGSGSTDTGTQDPIGDGGPATSATLYYFNDIKLDKWGNLYVNDFVFALVHVVYQGTQAPPLLAAEGISAPATANQYIYAIAGSLQNYCSSLSCGDDGPAQSAAFGSQNSIGVDADGNLYIYDYINSNYNFPYIRMVYAGGTANALLTQYQEYMATAGTPVTLTAGNIYPVTGYAVTSGAYSPCTASPCGDGATAATMQFGYGPYSGGGFLFVDASPQPNLYIADTYDNAVRKIDAAGYASTIAGVDDPAQAAATDSDYPSTPGGPATSTLLYGPACIAFDTPGNLYICDYANLFDGNNSISYHTAWVIAPKTPQTIDFPALTPSTVTYGVAPISLQATATSDLPVQFTATSTPSGIAQVVGSQLVITGAGSVTVTAAQPGNGLYSPAQSISQSLTVNPAALTVAADAASMVQGAALPNFTATITGFVNGDYFGESGVVTGAPSFSTAATSSSAAGTYAITPGVGTLSAANYVLAAGNFIDGTLTITGNQAQTINFAPFNPSSVPYGHPPLTLSASSSSGAPVTFRLVSGPGALVGTNNSTLTILGAGTIVVEADQVGNSQFAAASPVQQTVIVTPVALTVTGPSVTLPYAATIDTSTFAAATVTGFVGSDTQASSVAGSAQYTTVTGTPAPGTYPITVAQGTLQLFPAVVANYSFGTYVNGSLTITKATQTINFLQLSPTITYGSTVSLNATATSGLPVIYAVSGSAVFGSNGFVITGVGQVTVTATQAGNADYEAAAPVSQTFTVTPAPLYIIAHNQYREQGASNSTFTYQIGADAGVGAFVYQDTDIPSVISGIPDVESAADENSLPGTYPIIISQGTLTAPNYNFVFFNGVLTVSQPGTFAISINPTTLTIPTGLSAQATVTITPSNYYQGTITLSCGTLPANVSCVVSPSTYTFVGSTDSNGSESPARGTITINTAAGTIVGAVGAPERRISLASLWISGLLCGLLLFIARRRASRFIVLRGVLLAVCLSTMLLSLSSCGSKSGFLTAAPGTVNISINGSGTTPSGTSNVTAATLFTVNIQ